MSEDGSFGVVLPDLDCSLFLYSAYGDGTVAAGPGLILSKHATSLPSYAFAVPTSDERVEIDVTIQQLENTRDTILAYCDTLGLDARETCISDVAKTVLDDLVVMEDLQEQSLDDRPD